jgi:hypothetical protein
MRLGRFATRCARRLNRQGGGWTSGAPSSSASALASSRRARTTPRPIAMAAQASEGRLRRGLLRGRVGRSAQMSLAGEPCGRLPVHAQHDLSQLRARGRRCAMEDRVPRLVSSETPSGKHVRLESSERAEFPRKRENPLAHGHSGKHRINQVRRVLAVRRPAHTERALHEKATCKSRPYESQCARTNP